MEWMIVKAEGRSWTVRHKGSCLGHTNSRDEAIRIAESLVDWMRSEGRVCEVAVRDAETATFDPIVVSRERIDVVAAGLPLVQTSQATSRGGATLRDGAPASALASPS